MKRVALLITMFMAASQMHGYVIEYDSSGQLPETRVFVFKQEDAFGKWLRAQGMSDRAISTALNLTEKYAPQAGKVVSKIQAYSASKQKSEPTEEPTFVDNPLYIPSANPVEKTQAVMKDASGDSQIDYAQVAVEVAQVLKSLYDQFGRSLISKVIRQQYIPALHRLKPGQTAAWNKKDIAKDLKMEPTDELYVVVTTPQFEVVLQTTVLVGGRLVYTVTQNAQGELDGRVLSNTTVTQLMYELNPSLRQQQMQLGRPVR